MQILRRTANTVLWILAVVGAASGLIWGATAVGAIRPLVVISGSMEPAIMTGDLIVDVRTDTADLSPGDVVSLPSPLTHELVSHRIVSIEKSTDASSGFSFRIALKGDANEFGDAADYLVGDSVWTPALRLPGWGSFVLQISTPRVALPLGVGLIALLGITLLIPAPRRAASRRDAEAEPHDVEPQHEDAESERELAGIPS